MSLVLLGVVLRKMLHVVANVSSKDVLSKNVGVELLTLVIISNESLIGMGDLETSVSGSLQSGKDLASSRGSSETYVHQSAERSRSISEFLYVVILSVDISVSLVLVSEVKLGEDSSSQQ